jgi:hypothetical protein
MPRCEFYHPVTSKGTRDDQGHQPEYLLLEGLTLSENLIEDHDISTAPLMTREAFEGADYDDYAMQYGVMGGVVSTR